MKRILQEEELSQLEKNKHSNRMSERNYEAEMRRRQDELEQTKQEDKWIFDCSVCGLHGNNYVGYLCCCIIFLLTMSRTMVYTV